jgi:hypothetical protein
MKSNISKLILCLCISFTAKSNQAQHWLGNTLSNYGGTNAVYTNPASLGSNRYKVHVNAAGFGLNAVNDFVSWGAPFSVQDMIADNVPNQYKDSTGNVDFQSSWLKQNINGKNKNLYLEMEVRGPAVMYRINKKAAVSFSTRSRIGFNVSNVSEELAKLAVNGIDTAGISSNTSVNIGDNLDNLQLRMSALSFQEYAFSFGSQFLEFKSMRIKFGATAKFLVGNAYGYAQGDNIDMKISGTDSIRINDASFRYGYSDFDKFQDFTPGSLLPSFNGDYGFGWDAGAILEYDPRAADGVTSQKSNYLFKVGLSILDRGNIRFKNNVTSYTVSSKAPFTFVSDSIAEAAFNNGPTSQEARDFVDSLTDVHFNIRKRSEINYKLPSMLSIQFDYNVFKGFFIGALIYQDIRGINIEKISLPKPSQIAILPRFESKWIEASLPIVLAGDYKVLQVGGFVRLGPVFAGSDNLKAIVTGENFYGVNTYFGFAQGIGNNRVNKKEKKDKATNEARTFANKNIFAL